MQHRRLKGITGVDSNGLRLGPRNSRSARAKRGRKDGMARSSDAAGAPGGPSHLTAKPGDMGLSNPLSMVELAGQEEPAVRQSIVFTVVLHITGHHARLQHSQAGQCPTPISPIERPVVRRMRQMTSSMIGVTTVNMFAAPRLANARRLCPEPGQDIHRRAEGDG
ncbi:hypothetical protein X797_000087 [Metarhizium robertsii]|uniref:Uncharacterized protein n=1 Tax=Metarhizium robertsii TaxID=568076 RepID=A0A0A1V6B1_9HYPO|nr:hypothetical protein X797_000087 [Metarhizium robertsii]